MSYDISDAKRWRRVVKLAVTSGDRVQKSLFLCALSREQLHRLHSQLKHIVKAPTACCYAPFAATAAHANNGKVKANIPSGGSRIGSYESGF